MARRPSTHVAITSRKAPKSIGSCVPALKVESPGSMLFLSAQLPIEMPSGAVFTGDIKRQTDLVLNHIRNLVQEGGFTMDEVVRCTLYLTDLEHLSKVEQVYGKFFTGMAIPTRSVVEVSRLPEEVNIQMDVVAVKKAADPSALFR